MKTQKDQSDLGSLRVSLYSNTDNGIVYLLLFYQNIRMEWALSDIVITFFIYNLRFVKPSNIYMKNKNSEECFNQRCVKDRSPPPAPRNSST